MVFVLFFFVCCGVQYQCQCRMFYLYLVYNTCILYIYITKCMYNQFFFHHFHPVPQLFPINFLGMVTWRSSSASVERERPHCVLTHRWRIFRENDPQGFRFRGQFAWILCAPCFFFNSICILKVPWNQSDTYLKLKGTTKTLHILLTILSDLPTGCIFCLRFFISWTVLFNRLSW